MGRLIDVATLEKFIHEHRCVIGDDHLLLVAADDGRWQEALPLVKTAYDVDKVIGGLYGLKRYKNKYDRYYENSMYQMTEFENDKINSTIDEAIKIVKAGGKNE